MENGEWRMENGEWRMENGEWRMENGEWRMENGEWRMENGEWRMENGEWKGVLKFNTMRQFLMVLMIFLITKTVYCTGSLVNAIKFASVEKANELMTQEDDFTRSWSQFDIDSRMGKRGSTKEELFDFIKKQTREWTDEEKEKILGIIASIEEEIKTQNYKVNFPNEIYFVKTTADEEGGAGGYTRANYIVLKEGMMVGNSAFLKSLVIHELFHILTRNSPEFRKKMYNIIGFKMMNKIDYPVSINESRITNPDAPQTDSYITLEVNGTPKDCMMVLYSDREYNGGPFFNYLNIGFLSLIGEGIKEIEYKDGKPVIYSFQEVSGFYEQVGKNTQYIIHPEEILADNFTYVLLGKEGLPSPEIGEKMKLQMLM